MRLGAQSSDVKAGTLAHQIYGPVVTERHRHRYEANEHYLERLQQAGLVITAITQREKLTEIVELPRERAPLVRRRAVPPRVQEHALGRPPAVQQLHQGRAGAARGQASTNRMNGSPTLASVRCPEGRSAPSSGRAAPR